MYVFVRYARQKNTADQYYNLNFGLSIILGVAALQQAVMFGGLGNDTFESRMLSLAADIINASKWTCAAGCIAYDINYTVYEISQMHQELDAEVAMSFFQSVMFLLMIPFSLAMYTAQGSTPSGKFFVFVAYTLAHKHTRTPNATAVEGVAAGCCTSSSMSKTLSAISPVVF